MATFSMIDPGTIGSYVYDPAQPSYWQERLAHYILSTYAEYRTQGSLLSTYNTQFGEKFNDAVGELWQMKGELIDIDTALSMAFLNVSGTSLIDKLSELIQEIEFATNDGTTSYILGIRQKIAELSSILGDKLSNPSGGDLLEDIRAAIQELTGKVEDGLVDTSGGVPESFVKQIKDCLREALIQALGGTDTPFLELLLDALVKAFFVDGDVSGDSWFKLMKFIDKIRVALSYGNTLEGIDFE